VTLLVALLTLLLVVLYLVRVLQATLTPLALLAALALSVLLSLFGRRHSLSMLPAGLIASGRAPALCRGLLAVSWLSVPPRGLVTSLLLLWSGLLVGLGVCLLRLLRVVVSGRLPGNVPLALLALPPLLAGLSWLALLTWPVVLLWRVALSGLSRLLTTLALLVAVL
jgi:hypothetical protein